MRWASSGLPTAAECKRWPASHGDLLGRWRVLVGCEHWVQHVRDELHLVIQKLFAQVLRTVLWRQAAHFTWDAAP